VPSSGLEVLNKNTKGQGRPVTLTERKMYSLRLPIEMMDRIEGNKTQFVIDCVYGALMQKLFKIGGMK